MFKFLYNKYVKKTYTSPNNEINFYSVNEKFGCFSNFWTASPIISKKLGYFPTSEHFFQAMKYFDHDMPYLEIIRAAYTPAESAALGRDRSVPLRPDWEQVKDDVMRLAIAYKFNQNRALYSVLYNTDKKKLIEHTVNDKYWGDAGDGTGKNMLGILLMELRGVISKDEDVFNSFSSHIEEDNFWQCNPNYKTNIQTYIETLEQKLFPDA